MNSLNHSPELQRLQIFCRSNYLFWHWRRCPEYLFRGDGENGRDGMVVDTTGSLNWEFSSIFFFRNEGCLIGAQCGMQRCWTDHECEMMQIVRVHVEWITSTIFALDIYSISGDGL